MQTSPYGNQGIAGFETDSVTSKPLITGTPPVGTKSGVYSSPAADVPAFTVVGKITATGELVICNSGAADGSQNVVGVTVGPVFAQSPVIDQPVDYFYNGTFNPDVLNWHASFATDAQKKAAVELGTSQIVLRKISG